MRIKLMICGFILLAIGLGLGWLIGALPCLLLMWAGFILILIVWIPQVGNKIREKIREIVIYLKALKE